MTTALLMLVGGVGAGVFGSLLGLGGGVLIVPLLTLGFNLPVRDAVGVSIVCVIVNSGASAGVFLERRTANLRLGMLLELFTASGAVIGGLIAFLLDPRLLAGLFAMLLTYVALTMLRTPRAAPESEPAVAAQAVASDGPAWIERLSGGDYRIRRLYGGFAGSIVAGVASALLGIGGGLVKVPTMHLIMGVPLRVATATSNLMIGITASTSAWVYLLHGGINPFATGPMAIGVFVGATTGSRIAPRVHLGALRILFGVVLLYTAYEMLRRALGWA